MGTYVNADGSHVQFTDGEVYRQAAQLYAILPEDHSTGSSNLENDQVRQMLTDMQTGKPLNDAQHGLIQQLVRKYAKQLKAYQSTPDFKGQDFLSSTPAGQGRVTHPGLTESGRLREATPSSTPGDTARSSSHLLDSTLHDIAHATMHGQRLSAPDVVGDPESTKFNVEHLMTHLVSAQDHASRLGKTLEQYPSKPKVFKGDRDALKGLREDGDPAPKPPHLRKAVGPQYRCGTCRMFAAGKCTGYANYPVTPGQLCDSWAKDQGTVAPVTEAAKDQPREDAGRFFATSKVHDPLLLNSDSLHAAEVANSLVTKGRVRIGGQGPESEKAAADITRRVGDRAKVSKVSVQGNSAIQLKAVTEAAAAMSPSEESRLRGGAQ